MRDPSTIKILERNLDSLTGKKILVLNSTDGELLPLLWEHRPESEITFAHTDYRDARLTEHRIPHAGKSRITVKYGAWFGDSAESFDLCIAYLPKGRELRDLIFTMLACIANPAGRLVVVGPVRGGIKSAQKALEALFDEVTKLDNARHCALYEAKNRKADQSETTSLANWRREFTYTIGDKELSICSYPGVFSHEKLDDGTRMLLETITEIPNGRVLDFGCGCGIIGAWAHNCNRDAQIEMVDSNALAIEAARETAKIKGMSADCVYPSDVFSNVTGEFDLILSNPPFHTGIETDYEVSEKFFKAVAASLTSNGKIKNCRQSIPAISQVDKEIRRTLSSNSRR